MDANILTVGFARRATTYKRGDLLFTDIERLKGISSGVGSFQVIYAGKAHPKDQGGKELMKRIFQAKEQLKHDVKIAYLENYDMKLGMMITSGVDLWLNTPQPPMEASGTSGMKAALNGVPNLSVLDGWWIEGHIEGVTGWSIGETNRRKKDYFYATQKASSIGKGIALFFIFFGLFSIFTGGPGGLWLMFIGWFLYSAAQASYQQSTLQEILSGIKVKDIVVREMQTIDPSISLDKAVDEYFLRYGYGGFPVIDDGKFLGILTLKEVKDVPRENWGKVKVSEISIPHEKRWEVSSDVDVMKALELMIKEDKGRIVVTEKERIIGLITRNGIARYVQIKGK